MQWPSVGPLFALPQDQLYFASCSRCPLPTASVDAGHAQLLVHATTPWAHSYGALRDQVRASVAQLVCAEPSQVHLFPCASHAASAAGRLMRRGQGARMRCVVLRDEAEMIAIPAQESFAGLVVADSPRDVLGLLELHDDVGAAFLTHAFWTTGLLLPHLDQVVALCARRGVALLLDVTQSLGVMSYDVRALFGAYPALRCALIASVHKHLLSSYGCCVAWFSSALTNGAQPLDGLDLHCKGLAVADQWTVAGGGMAPGDRGFLVDRSAFHAFESGQSNAVTWAVLKSSLGLLLGWDAAALVAHLARLTRDARAHFAACGFHIPYEAVDCAPHFFWAGHASAAAVVEALSARGVHVQLRHGGIRFAVGAFNDANQVARFGVLLREVVASLP